MYVKIVKNFVSKEELNVLNSWTLKNFKCNSHWYKDAGMDEFKEQTRFTTRLGNEVDHKREKITINYPQEAYNIQKRIKKFFRLENCKQPPSFVDGIVNGIGFEGGSICTHIDPEYFDDTSTLHCNVISQKSISGGVTIIENNEYDIDEGDLLCYIVSKQYHRVTETVGSKNRILWVFGFCIDDEKTYEMFGK